LEGKGPAARQFLQGALRALLRLFGFSLKDRNQGSRGIFTAYLGAPTNGLQLAGVDRICHRGRWRLHDNKYAAVDLDGTGRSWKDVHRVVSLWIVRPG
jgi:hypothetical protein